MAVYRQLENGARIVNFSRIINNDMANHYKSIRSLFNDKGVYFAATYYICQNLIYLIRFHHIKAQFRMYYRYKKEFKSEIEYLKINKQNGSFLMAYSDMNDQFRSLKKELIYGIFSKKFLLNAMLAIHSRPSN